MKKVLLARIQVKDGKFVVNMAHDDDELQNSAGVVAKTESKYLEDAITSAYKATRRLIDPELPELPVKPI